MGRMAEVALVISSRPHWLTDEHLGYIDRLMMSSAVAPNEIPDRFSNDFDVPDAQAREAASYWIETKHFKDMR